MVNVKKCIVQDFNSFSMATQFTPPSYHHINWTIKQSPNRPILFLLFFWQPQNGNNQATPNNHYCQ